MEELKTQSYSRTKRFISTHPDEDHIKGIKVLDDEDLIPNFYCVKNETTKEEETDDFKHYCNLKNGDKSYYLKKGIRRKWLNKPDETNGSSGITILWPKTDNEYYIEELEKVKEGNSPNNICPIIQYSLEDGVTCLWMGDLEKNFINKVKDDIIWPEVDILFAPHHGRKSGKLSKEILDKINPLLIVIGEAPSDEIDYEYYDYDTITQNTAKDILFECNDGKVSVYVSSESYATDGNVKKFDNIGEMYLDKELKVNDKNIKKANKQMVLKNRLIRLLEE